MLFVIKTLEEVKEDVESCARIAFVAFPNKDPVNPSVEKTDPVTIRSDPKFEPVIIREPVISAGVLPV